MIVWTDSSRLAPDYCNRKVGIDAPLMLQPAGLSNFVRSGIEPTLYDWVEAVILCRPVSSNQHNIERIANNSYFNFAVWVTWDCRFIDSIVDKRRRS